MMVKGEQIVKSSLSLLDREGLGVKSAWTSHKFLSALPGASAFRVAYTKFAISQIASVLKWNQRLSDPIICRLITVM